MRIDKRRACSAFEALARKFCTGGPSRAAALCLESAAEHAVDAVDGARLLRDALDVYIALSKKARGLQEAKVTVQNAERVAHGVLRTAAASLTHAVKGVRDQCLALLLYAAAHLVRIQVGRYDLAAVANTVRMLKNLGVWESHVSTESKHHADHSTNAIRTRVLQAWYMAQSEKSILLEQLAPDAERNAESWAREAEASADHVGAAAWLITLAQFDFGVSGLRVDGHDQAVKKQRHWLELASHQLSISRKSGQGMSVDRAYVEIMLGVLARLFLVNDGNTTSASDARVQGHIRRHVEKWKRELGPSEASATVIPTIQALPVEEVERLVGVTLGHGLLGRSGNDTEAKRDVVKDLQASLSLDSCESPAEWWCYLVARRESVWSSGTVFAISVASTLELLARFLLAGSDFKGAAICIRALRYIVCTVLSDSLSVIGKGSDAIELRVMNDMKSTLSFLSALSCWLQEDTSSAQALLSASFTKDAESRRSPALSSLLVALRALLHPQESGIEMEALVAPSSAAPCVRVLSLLARAAVLRAQGKSLECKKALSEAYTLCLMDGTHKNEHLSVGILCHLSRIFRELDGNYVESRDMLVIASEYASPLHDVRSLLNIQHQLITVRTRSGSGRGAEDLARLDELQHQLEAQKCAEL
ncbi:hypothetical protein FVE85_0752 [Porphyridium purpureum]|uniref:Uncharacterized protein n=1 Tax=Porphyridium purpureum TaxID=35688 RepID=A0A5J4Z286_PORPP|nr:hypothetical protein FVE85_0752 [Porphyridium purpureum]|eukprot:POR0409..scf208_2